jgi:hypothetical protein
VRIKTDDPSAPAAPEPVSAGSACRSYVKTLLALYVQTPGVLGRVRHADRQLARKLFDQGIPLYAVEDAFIVGAARRAKHNAFSTPLPPIRSLHYFQELIREMLERPPGYREIDELRRSLGIRAPQW